ncbi:MAG: hypothetical protein M0R46_15100 [Candidatus Muirbacterium halophilum]|nr:hypothetical protein [Candidatus Muirbacterium halophilum]MCK9477243.1 hypothetical protein [Candidatus Muirbacterium halophilum]
MKKLFSIIVMTALSVSVFSNSVFFLPENDSEKYGLNISRSRASSNVPERINILCKELKHTDSRLKASFNGINDTINKQWYLNSEFEKDLNVMLTMFRESVDYISNLDDRAQALELELFNPEELGFNKLYSSLADIKKNTEASYTELSKGKSGLRKAREIFEKAVNSQSNISALITSISSAVLNAVPYNPPAPAPTPTPAPVVSEPDFDYSKMEVSVKRKKVKLSDYDFIKLESVEGKNVIKKSMERLHELSSIDKFLYKEALRKKEGYSVVIIKNSKNKYIICWWHVADEIAGVIETIGDIFK